MPDTYRPLRDDMPEPRTDRDDWQPIETAPKDRRWILATDGQSVFPMIAGMPLLIYPEPKLTAWMPLPTPPLEHNDAT